VQQAEGQPFALGHRQEKGPGGVLREARGELREAAPVARDDQVLLGGERLQRASRGLTRLEGTEKRVLANRALDVGHLGARLLQQLAAAGCPLHAVFSFRPYGPESSAWQLAPRRSPSTACGRDGAQEAEAPFSVCFLVLDLSVKS